MSQHCYLCDCPMTPYYADDWLTDSRPMTRRPIHIAGTTTTLRELVADALLAAVLLVALWGVVVLLAVR
jgi:hypothetical protein